jgi:hypothetical protein
LFLLLPRTQTQQVSTQASKVLSCAGATFDVKVKNCNLLNGLVLWLPMDEGSGTIAYDYSGYGNNGTLYNSTNICSNPPTPGCPTWVDGKFGKALSFDGIDDYAKIEPFTVYGWEEYTLAAWINPTAIPSSGVRKTLMIGKNLSVPVYWYGTWVEVFPPNSFKLIACKLWRPSDNAYYEISQTYSLLDYLGKWTYIVLTVSKLNKSVSIYLNGAMVKTIDISSYLAAGYQTIMDDSSVNRFVIGANSLLDENSPVIHDEVRLYNRVLTDDEIKELYYNGLTNKFNITIGLLNSGYADLGKSFTAIVYLKNGTILQLPLVLDNNLSKGYYLEKTLTIDGYYPSYGLVDKIMVCSNDCQGVCSEIKINNQC